MDTNTVRLLVIDDNPFIYDDFKKILLSQAEQDPKLQNLEEVFFGNKTSQEILFPPLSIDYAMQGEEGIEMVQNACQAQSPYSIIFIDVRMPPGIDGIETTQRILPIDPNAQLVICTAYSDYAWEKIVEKVGKRDNVLILKKPFDVMVVKQLVLSLIKKWEVMRHVSLQTKILESKIDETESLLQKKSLHDDLTKLPNRKFLFQFLKNQIENASSGLYRFVVLMMNVDRFKLINQSLGNAVGDLLLMEFVKRMRENSGGNDFFARLNGDEFVMVLFDVNAVPETKNRLEKIFEFLRVYYVFDNHKINLFVSMGVAFFPHDGKTVDELLMHAGSAMLRAKELGGNQFQFYSSDLHYDSVKRLELEAEIYSAVDQHEFFLVYQPQYNLSQERIVSTEALIRWQHPKLGVLYPIDFIPVAEEIGVFRILGDWIIRTACEENARWQKKGCAFVVIAVNITPQQFRQPDFVENIEKILQETRLQPRYLELEIVESVLLSYSDAVSKLSRLHEMGVSVAIDDFGIGYSCLNYLKNLPVNKLKIDQSFIQNIETSVSDEAIIQTIIDLGRKLHLDVLAEGIETEAQLAFVKKNACQTGQGFYFSHPVSGEEMERLLKKS